MKALFEKLDVLEMSKKILAKHYGQKKLIVEIWSNSEVETNKLIQNCASEIWDRLRQYKFTHELSNCTLMHIKLKWAGNGDLMEHVSEYFFIQRT